MICGERGNHTASLPTITSDSDITMLHGNQSVGIEAIARWLYTSNEDILIECNSRESARDLYYAFLVRYPEFEATLDERVQFRVGGCVVARSE
jgi:hypothetical protein